MLLDFVYYLVIISPFVLLARIIWARAIDTTAGKLIVACCAFMAVLVTLYFASWSQTDPQASLFKPAVAGLVIFGYLVGLLAGWKNRRLYGHPQTATKGLWPTAEDAITDEN